MTHSAPSTLARLAKELNGYAEHGPRCIRRYLRDGVWVGLPCTCGLTALQQQLAQALADNPVDVEMLVDQDWLNRKATAAQAEVTRLQSLVDEAAGVLEAIAGWEDVSSAAWDRKFPKWNERFKRLVAHFGNETLAFRDLAIEIARDGLRAIKGESD